MLDSESSNESATETETNRFFRWKMQREDSNLDYLLLLSIADCYSRGKPLPNASFLFEECKIKDLLFARYIVL